MSTMDRTVGGNGCYVLKFTKGSPVSDREKTHTVEQLLVPTRSSWDWKV